MNQPLDELGAICAEARRAVLHGRDRVAGRERVRDGRVGPGRGDRRAAEVPERARRAARRSRCRSGPSTVIRGRTRIEAGIRDESDEDTGEPVHSNYFDLGMILDYWGPRRLNHHTEATTMLYGAHECARVILEEGRAGGDRPARARRPRDAGRRAGARACRCSATSSHKMNNVVAVAHPGGGRGRRRARRPAERLRHRDRHVVRAAARARVAHRDHGRQRAPGHGAGDARPPWSRCCAGTVRRVPAGGGVDAAYEAWG